MVRKSGKMVSFAKVTATGGRGNGKLSEVTVRPMRGNPDPESPDSYRGRDPGLDFGFFSC